jgi:hypothetical protein
LVSFTFSEWEHNTGGPPERQEECRARVKTL